MNFHFYFDQIGNDVGTAQSNQSSFGWGPLYY